MKQSDVFLKGEAKAWLARNKEKLTPDGDQILDIIQGNGMRFNNVLEVGCANGWRLKEMKRLKLANEVFGLDPGARVTRNSIIERGTANNLKYFVDWQVDCIIYGWCLYLCDPIDYFKIAAEGDRVLKDGGFLIIHDFYSMSPYRNKYKHKDGIYSHKMNFSKLWLSSPAYSVYRCQIQGSGDDQTMTIILKKNLATAFQERA